MEIKINLTTATLIIIAISIIQFLIANWTKSRIDNSIKAEYAKILEDYKFDLKAREQAAKVAEYIALYQEDSKNFSRMNQLSFELALWLPEDIYKNLGKALIKADGEKNIFQVLVDIRKVILRKPTGLTDKDIIFHAEGIGKKREENK